MKYCDLSNEDLLDLHSKISEPNDELQNLLLDRVEDFSVELMVSVLQNETVKSQVYKKVHESLNELKNIPILNLTELATFAITLDVAMCYYQRLLEKADNENYLICVCVASLHKSIADASFEILRTSGSLKPSDYRTLLIDGKTAKIQQASFDALMENYTFFAYELREICEQTKNKPIALQAFEICAKQNNFSYASLCDLSTFAELKIIRAKAILLILNNIEYYSFMEEQLGNGAFSENEIEKIRKDCADFT